MPRLLIALPVALFISYLLMGLMAWMVDLNQHRSKSPSEALQFDMYMLEQEQDSRRLQRSLPEPPEMKPLAPEVTPTQPTLAQPISNPSFESLPDINMDLAVTGMNISVPSIDVKDIQQSTNSISTPSAELGQSQQVMPLHRVNPVYPRKALQRKIEGFVELSFDIDKSGKPKNIKIVDAKPGRIFNREALKALRNWKYQPRMVNGQALERLGQRVKLEFKLQ